MEKWEDSVLKSMNESLTGTREKDLRFFRIEELQRNISRAGEFSAHCAHCRHFKSEIQTTIAHVSEAVNVPGQYRKELDRLISRLSRHMMKSHGFFPPYHYTYLYSFYGMLAGALLGFMALVVTPGSRWELMIAGVTALLIAGQVMGAKKDRAVRSAMKLM
jgi:hypothetical protein